jgi:hypothetical protein
MALSWLQQWRARQARISEQIGRKQERESKRRRPRLELLEDRIVPAPSPLTPGQVTHAYGLDQIRFGGTIGDGAGQTIAIIDAGDDSALLNSGASNFNTSDLYQFDHLPEIHLPDPPSFTVIGENGGPRPTYNASSIATATESGNVVTITTTAPHGFTRFEQVVITGAGAYNGSFQITSVTPTTFTYTDTPGLTNSSGGTATPQNPVNTLETTLDVEWAHAIAPGANIVLIELSSGLFPNPDILNGVHTAASIGASVVSMSFGGSEFPGETSTNSSLYDDATFTAPGTTYIASTGDNAVPGGYPAFSPNVLAVGATNLNLNPDGSYQGEKGWSAPPAITGATESGNLVTITTATATGLTAGNSVAITGVGVAGYNGTFIVTSVASDTSFTYLDPNVDLTPSGGGTVFPGGATGNNTGGSGGGISQFEAQPAYQQGTVTKVTQSTTNRAIPDVSFVGGTATPVETYDSLGPGGPEFATFGTSVSAPCWAGLVAIADQGLSLRGQPLLDSHSTLQTALYDLPLTDFHDITSGYNGFAASPGYDLVTGIGTPVANLLVPDLAGTSLEVDVTKGAHQLLLRKNGADVELLDNGTVVASQPLSTLSDVNVIEGNNSGASLTVDYSFGGSFNVPGGIFFSGGARGSNTLIVNDENDTDFADWQAEGSVFTLIDRFSIGSKHFSVSAGFPYNNVGNLVLEGGAGGNTFEIAPSSQQLDQLPAAITVTGGTSGDTLDVNDQANTHFSDWQVEAGTLTRTYKVGQFILLPITTTITYSGIGSVAMNGGIGGNTFEIAPSGQQLDQLPAAITVTGGTSGDTLDVNDQANTHFSDWQVEAGTLTRTYKVGQFILLPITTTITYSGIGSVAMNGGVGGNTFEIAPSGQQLDQLPADIAVAGGTTADSLFVNDEQNTHLSDWEFNAGVFTRTYRLFGGTTSIPVTTTIDYTTVGNLSVGGGNGGNTFNVNETAMGTSTTIVAGGGDDMFNVGGTANTLDAIQGPITLNGGGKSALAVNDQGNGAVSNYDLTDSYVDRYPAGGPRPAVPQITYSNMATVTVGTGTGRNFVGVESTSANASNTVVNGNGGGGDEIIVNGIDDTLNGIRGPLHVHDVSPANLFVDELNPIGQTYQVMAGEVQRNGIQPITYDNMAEFVLGIGTNPFPHTPNTVNLQSLGAGVFAVIAVGAGDSVNVGHNGTLAEILGDIRVQGDTGQPPKQVTLDDSLDENTPNPQTINLGSDPVFGYLVGGLLPAGGRIGLLLDPASPVVLDAGPGAHTFQVRDLIGSPALTLNGNSKNNTLRGPDAPNTWRVSGANAGTLDGIVGFASVQNLVGGSANDVFDLQTGGSLDGSLNGGGGTNTLDYTAYKGDVFVDLLRQTASLVGQGVSNVANVFGSQGNNLIVGDAGPNVLVGGTGRNVIIGDGGSDQITGGDGFNLLIGGLTSYDSNLDALHALMAYWDNPGDTTLDQLVNPLRHGIQFDGQFLVFNKSTVQNDNAPDSLVGGNGPNWFIADKDDTINNGNGPKSNDRLLRI